MDIIKNNKFVEIWTTFMPYGIQYEIEFFTESNEIHGYLYEYVHTNNHLE